MLAAGEVVDGPVEMHLLEDVVPQQRAPAQPGAGAAVEREVRWNIITSVNIINLYLHSYKYHYLLSNIKYKYNYTSQPTGGSRLLFFYCMACQYYIQIKKSIGFIYQKNITTYLSIQKC